jgi:hypothetical protein
MHHEAGFTGDFCGRLVKFQPFNLITIIGIDPQTTALVASDIDESPTAYPSIETDIAIYICPQSVCPRTKEPFSNPAVKFLLSASKVVVRLIKLFELVGCGQRMYQPRSTVGTASDLVFTPYSEPRIEQLAYPWL